jgi:hypothetical protein
LSTALHVYTAEYQYKSNTVFISTVVDLYSNTNQALPITRGLSNTISP